MSRIADPQRRQLWQDRLDRFAQSELTVAEFCRSESISVPSFYQWKKKLAIKPVKRHRPKTRSAGGNGFIPLAVHAASATAQPVLQLPGGATIQLPSELAPQQLTELIRAVVNATEHFNPQRAEIA
jgi:hypothetical protein